MLLSLVKVPWPHDKHITTTKGVFGCRYIEKVLAFQDLGLSGSGLEFLGFFCRQPSAPAEEKGTSKASIHKMDMGGFLQDSVS